MTGARIAAPVARRGSLRTQLIAWNVCALALLLGVLGVAVRYSVLTAIMTSVDHDLSARAMRPEGRGGPPPPGPGGALGPPQRMGGMGDRPLPPFPGPAGDGMMLPDGRPSGRGAGGVRDPYQPHHFDPSGQPVDPDDTRPVWDPAGLARAERGEIVFATRTVDGVPVRIVSRPVPPTPPYRGEVQIAYPLTDVYRAMDGLNRALLLLIPVGLLGAGAGGAYLTDRVLRRVRQMAQAAGRIGGEDLSARLPVAGNDEFAELADTFNGMLGRLEAAFRKQEQLIEQQRRFTADASHELKTPLTVIKGNASMALRGHPTETAYHQSMEEIDQAANSMSHLVQDLLLLARADAGRLGREPIELLVREVLERAVARIPRPAGRAAPVTLNIADEALSVHGNEQELIRLFANLIENAVRYTPPEGRITLTARREGGRAVISVADTGVGIASEHLAHLGERFYRVDEARSRPDGGTGLGLSIARGIAEAHGGAIAFASTPGKGTTATVTLPAR